MDRRSGAIPGVGIGFLVVIMDWSDEAAVLSVRKHGESGVIAQLLTRGHGRHAGLVRGGAGRRARGVFQPGNRVTAQWRARLNEHLGTFTCELLESNAAELLESPDLLAGLSAACATAEGSLPEREPHSAVFFGFTALVDALKAAAKSADQGRWAEAYIRWELGLLGELGFGLDLTKCASTGRNDNLAYVSPKSGRAVSLSAGEEYRDRLLPLPKFLVEKAEPSEKDIADGLKLTGYFLERHVFAPHDRKLPAARTRLADRLVPATE